MTITPEQLRARSDDFDWLSSDDYAMLADAIEIADESSDSLLYSMLRPAEHGWLDLSMEMTEDERETVDQAVRYLTARGLIERHPEQARWVRVKEPEDVAA